MIIQRIESQIDLISKTTELYDFRYCSKDNNSCSFQSSHIIRLFVQTNYPCEFMSGFKSHCTSINERFSKLGGFVHSRPKIKRNTFPPFSNEFLPPSKTISLTVFPIPFPLKQKHLCNYDTRCIMSSGLMFDDIIMNIITSNKLERHNEEDDCF